MTVTIAGLHLRSDCTGVPPCARQIGEYIFTYRDKVKPVVLNSVLVTSVWLPLPFDIREEKHLLSLFIIWNLLYVYWCISKSYNSYGLQMPSFLHANEPAVFQVFSKRVVLSVVSQ